MITHEQRNFRPELPENSLAEDEQLYISELQRYLRTILQQENPPRFISIDGILDEETRQEIRAFQQSVGLPPTGTVDFMTWEMIFDEYNRILRLGAQSLGANAFPSADARLTVGARGDAVLLLQLMINSLSARFANIPFVPQTGVYDAAAANAVSRLQQLFGLPADGITDLAAWNAITGAYNALIQENPGSEGQAEADNEI